MATTHPPVNSFKPGATWEIQGSLHYANGTPFNLGPGCNIQWALQNSMGQIVLSLSLGDGITVQDADAGICYIIVLPGLSATIPPGSYVDQLRATDPSGYISDQWQGAINIYGSFFD